MDNRHLEVKNLSIHFPGQSDPAVNNLSFSLQRGQCLGLVGESGSGKSLTSLAVMQLLPDSALVSQSSKVLYNDSCSNETLSLLDMSERCMRGVRGRKIGLIFQDASTALNPVLTIAQQLYELIPGRVKDKKAHAIRLLEEVGVRQPEVHVHSYPHQLSGGMRQRAMIAMALAGEPDLLIADEPTTALDVTIQAQVMRLLQRIRRDHQMSMVFISHDLALVSHVADDVVVMQNGSCVEKNSSQQFFRSPESVYSKKLLDAIPGKEIRQECVREDEKPLLTVKNLKVHFPIKSGLFKRTTGFVKAVDGIGYSLSAGRTLAVVGESGSGKTTSALAVLRLLQEAQGEVNFNDSQILSASESSLDKKNKHFLLNTFRKDIQIVFQDPYAALNPKMLLIHSLSEGLLAQKIVNHSRLPEIEVIIDDALEKVGLDPQMKWRYPHEFSGGQRQRLCIARALVLKPKLLVLDEPTSALDMTTQMQILNLLDTLQKKMNLAYLLITHNLGVVAHMAHDVLVMYQGSVVEYGEVHSVLNTPQHDYTQTLLAAVPHIKT